MTGRDRDRRSWIRYSTLGIEFVAAVAGFALVGFWIDRHYETKPWGLLIGAVLGIVGGMYNFIRTALAAFKDLEKTGSEGKEEEPRPKP